MSFHVWIGKLGREIHIRKFFWIVNIKSVEKWLTVPDTNRRAVAAITRGERTRGGIFVPGLWSSAHGLYCRGQQPRRPLWWQRCSIYSLNIVFSPGSQTYRRRLSARHQGKGRRSSSEGRGRPTASRNYGLWRSFYILLLRNIEAVTASAPSSSVLVKVLFIFTQRGQSQFRFSYSIASI